MIKILFVCLGNICRSPMAKYVFQNMVNQKGWQDEFFIDSAGTSKEEEGNQMHRGTKAKLQENGIPYNQHQAKQIRTSDYETFDYIIGMEQKNCDTILKMVRKDKKNKVSRLLDFTQEPRDIADPWYTGDFEQTYQDIIQGCQALLDNIIENKVIQ